jgi:hypothetical protein
MNRTEKNELVNLNSFFNGKGVTWEELGIEGRLDYQGLNIHGNIIPNGETITAGGTMFAFPRTDSEAPDHISCEGQLLELNASRAYHQAAFLGFCTWGHYKGHIMIRYADGSVEKQTLALSDWVQAQLGTNGFFQDELAFTFPYCHQENKKVDRVHGFFVDRIALDSSKAVSSIELPDNPNIYLFALTLVGSE